MILFKKKAAAFSGMMRCVYLLLRFIPWGPNRSHFRQLKVYNVFIYGAIVLFLDNEQIF